MRIDRDRGLLVCGHCGSQQEAPAAFKHLDLLGETSSLCPTCSTPLSRSRLEGHPLLCCARCFGMLIDMNRFTSVIDAVRAHEHARFGWRCRASKIPLTRRSTVRRAAIRCFVISTRVPGMSSSTPVDDVT
jgi:endogenous inhibitor of DNA gyrase (YacG/DUF329 family)